MSSTKFLDILKMLQIILTTLTDTKQGYKRKREIYYLLKTDSFDEK